MRNHTDSEIITYNEDGSWTTKSEITTYPATPKEQAIALGILAGILVLPFVPLIALDVRDRIAERRAAKKAAKKTD